MRTVFTLFLMPMLLVPAGPARNTPPAQVRRAVDALLKMVRSPEAGAVARFLDRTLAPAARVDRGALMRQLTDLRAAVGPDPDDVAVRPAGSGVDVTFSGGGRERLVHLEMAADGIRTLTVTRPPPPLKLTRRNLEKTVTHLAAEGMAGVIFVRLDKKILLQRAFGAANPGLAIPNRLDTVFGIGSRPMDFTAAAILLLDQEGRLDLAHPISKYLENVPADKQVMTLRHLLTERSGLPDFFHAPGDWDPDLAWVDRREALRRLLAAPLKFAPGRGRAHSHAAFGLLAALVEIVSGQSYMDFLNQRFFVPAGMTRTGEYGCSLGLGLGDFAAGAGPQRVGLPNIPPNWGPTSWLVKGSGGMFSTLADLRRFYAFVRSGRVLDSAHARVFNGPTVNLDGSDRGFELFSAWFPPGNEVYLFVNNPGDRGRFRLLTRALEKLAASVQGENKQGLNP